MSGVLDRYVVFTGEDEGVVSVATSERQRASGQLYKRVVNERVRSAPVSMGGGTTSVTCVRNGSG